MRARLHSPRPVAWRSLLRPCLAVLVLVLVCLAHSAQGCPTCKAGLGAHDPAHGDLVTAYMWSILFMMSMPFTLLASFSGYMYWLVRKARAAVKSPADSSASSADSQPAYASAQQTEPEAAHA